MVWACVVATRQFAYCAELNVRYRQPLAPGDEVVVRSELVADRKGRIFEARAEACSAAGTTLVEATGKYIPIKAASVADMVTDFVGDASWIVTPERAS
jgi:acyl-coenzyme A thioesterase PaaI-like protein